MPWKKLFDITHAVDLLAGQSAKESYRYEKEVHLFLLYTWILWPEDKDRLRSAARLICAVIAMSRRDEGGNFIPEVLVDLPLLRQRFEEEWFQDFYNGFYSAVGGLPSIIKIYRPQTF